MSDPEDFDAWNNSVMMSQPEDFPENSLRRAAALAKHYMNGVNSGGINSFLTNNWELGGDEIVEALNTIGASEAAEQLSGVLHKLERPITASSQQARWQLLEDCWPDDADVDYDMLSSGAESGLMQALESHVEREKEFYRTLGD